MTAHDLLSQLRAKGVDIKSSGEDRLVIDAPRGTITDDLRTALSANKLALIQILKDEDASAQIPVETNRTPAPESARPSPSPQAVPPVQNLVQQPEPSYSMEPIAGAKEPAAPRSKNDVADNTAEEVARLQNDLMRLRRDESARRAEVDAA